MHVHSNQSFNHSPRLLLWDSSLPYGVGVTVGVAAGGGIVRTQPQQECVFEGVEGEVTASAAAPDGSMLALGSDDGIVSVVRLADLQVGDV